MLGAIVQAQTGGTAARSGEYSPSRFNASCGESKTRPGDTGHEKTKSCGGTLRANRHAPGAADERQSRKDHRAQRQERT